MRTNPALDQLAVRLKQLRIEYEKYFNGALDIPPGELRYSIQTQIRQLRETVRGSVDKFKLSTLESQFNSYSELFQRRVRDREEGRVPGPRPVARRPAYNPQEGVIVQEQPDEGAVAALYQGLCADERTAKRVDLESFRNYLNQQASAIRAKTGCAQVQFRVANEDGKMKLKAKPIQGERRE